MSHRLSLSLAGLAVVAGGMGCQDDPAPPPCTAAPTRFLASELMLLPDARLDRVGDGFVLLGSDQNSVLWATIDQAGHLGAEHSVAVPAHSEGPWFGMAGTAASPADHVVVAYVAANTPAVDPLDLTTFAVNADGTAPTAPAVTAQIPSGAYSVVAVSGRSGAHMGLSWALSGTTFVSARVFGPDASPVGDALSLSPATNSKCLTFLPGKQDMTVGFIDAVGTPPLPTFVGTEITEAGASQSPFSLPLSIGAPPTDQVDPGLDRISCATLLPTDAGYGVAWKAPLEGDSFGAFDQTSRMFIPYTVIPDPVIPDMKGAPVVAGLGAAGLRYALVLDRGTGGEEREIDFMGRQIGSPLPFPTTASNTGTIATQPVGAHMFATYADYSSSNAADRTAGGRVFLDLTCP